MQQKKSYLCKTRLETSTQMSGQSLNLQYVYRYFYKSMKKAIILFVALFCAAGLLAQTSKLPTVIDIVSVEDENTGDSVEIVNIPVEGVNYYWLHFGEMGIGNRTVQINLDPVYQLYIPLGENITGAVATMEELKTLFKEPNGTTREIQGSFKPFFPGENLETVKAIKYKPLLTNQIQFVIERDGYLRLTYISKSDFNSLLRGLKLHGKLHPSEK